MMLCIVLVFSALLASLAIVQCKGKKSPKPPTPNKGAKGGTATKSPGPQKKDETKSTINKAEGEKKEEEKPVEEKKEAEKNKSKKDEPKKEEEKKEEGEEKKEEKEKSKKSEKKVEGSKKEKKGESKKAEGSKKDKKDEKKKEEEGEKKEEEEKKDEGEEKKDDPEKKKEASEKKKDEPEKKDADGKVVVTPTELKWTDKAKEQTITIKNPGQRRAFKVRCSDNALFKITPVFVILKPGESGTVNINRNAGPIKEDRIEVVYTLATDEKDKAEEIFKKADVKTETTTILCLPESTATGAKKDEGEKKKEEGDKKKEDGEKKEDEDKEEGEKKEDGDKKEGEKKDDEKKEGSKKGGDKKDGEKKDGDKKEEPKKEGEKKEEPKKDEEKKDGDKKEEKKDDEKKDGSKEGEKKDEEKKDGDKKDDEKKDADKKDDAEKKKDEPEKKDDAAKKDDFAYEPKTVNFAKPTGKSVVTVTNTTGKRSAVKVKVSNNQIYKINPVFAFVPAGAQHKIEIDRASATDGQNEKIVIVCANCEDADKDPAQVFKTVAVTAQKQITIPVTFVK